MILDIAPSELILVGVVALLVIPPRDLPKALRYAGKWVGQARGLAQQFRSGFDDMVRDSELAEMEKKWRAENERIMREHPPESLPHPDSTPPAEMTPMPEMLAEESDAAALPTEEPGRQPELIRDIPDVGTLAEVQTAPPPPAVRNAAKPALLPPMREAVAVRDASET